MCAKIWPSCSSVVTALAKEFDISFTIRREESSSSNLSRTMVQSRTRSTIGKLEGKRALHATAFVLYENRNFNSCWLWLALKERERDLRRWGAGESERERLADIFGCVCAVRMCTLKNSTHLKRAGKNKFYRKFLCGGKFVSCVADVVTKNGWTCEACRLGVVKSHDRS